MYVFVSRQYKTTFFTLDYRLIILCSSEGNEKSHIISHLYTYQHPFNPPSDGDMKKIEDYLHYHMIQLPDKTWDTKRHSIYASCIDVS